MDFKKLFRKDDKAVSPVIGVILMVAITVILAAAIGSSVFSHGTAQSAPQASLNIKPGTSGTNPTINVEHIGGDSIYFDDATKTKIMVTVGSNNSVQVDNTKGGFKTMGVGDVSTITLNTKNSSENCSIGPGGAMNIKVIDIPTSQLICDKNIRFP